MTTGQEVTLQALRQAVQMEIDGKAFYLKASQQSRHEMGRRLLARLAEEEDFHRRKFEEIFQSIQQQGWPRVGLAPDRSARLEKTVFALAREALDTGKTGSSSELEAVQQAMELENKTWDFYRRRSQAATATAEKEFYEAVAAEESAHHRLLRDYYEYLLDPAAWFTAKEHPSLDA